MKPRQRIVRTRRQYNQWVGSQTLEDYALRYTAATLACSGKEQNMSSSFLPGTVMSPPCSIGI